MTPLYLVVANQLKIFKKEVDELIAKNISKDEAILQVLRQYVNDSKRILFEGNSYSDAWVKEARERGLPNIKSTPQALVKALSPKIVELYERENILTKRELLARHDIKMKKYTMQIQIESRVIGDLATNHIIPVAIKYQSVLMDNVKGLKEVLDNKTFVKLSKNQLQSIKDISEHISEIRENTIKMVEQRKIANNIENAEEQAIYYNEQVYPFFDVIRYHVDKLELMVDDSLWPLPKYREMLFIG